MILIYSRVVLFLLSYAADVPSGMSGEMNDGEPDGQHCAVQPCQRVGAR